MNAFRSDAFPGLRLLGWAGIGFISAALLGLYLRGVYAWQWPLPIPAANLLHGHSHTAYFGWAGLAVMGLTYQILPGLTGRPLAATTALRLQLALAPWAVAGAMLAFLYQGYGPISIAFSALNEVVWYLFIYVFWRQVRGAALWRSPALLYLGLAMLYLFLATVGTYLLGIVGALNLTHPLARNSGIYLFLHAFGDGFVLLVTIGLVLGGMPGILGRSRWADNWLRRAAFLQGVLLLPAFLRLLIPMGLQGAPAVLGVLTGAMLVLPQGMVLWVGWQVRRRVQMRYPAAAPWLVLAWWSLALKAGLELVPLLPGWDLLALDRQVTVAYLHLKLLGFFTPAVLALLQVRAEAPASAWTCRLAFLYAVGTAGLLVALVGISLAARFFAAGVLPLVGAAALLNWLPFLGALPVLLRTGREGRVN